MTIEPTPDKPQYRHDQPITLRNEVLVAQYAGGGPPQPVVRQFVFDGGAGTYLGSAIAAFLVTFLSVGLLTPWAIVIRYRWRSKHTIINGYRIRFTGSAAGLFGNWLKWWFFIIITAGVYSFWVAPRLTRWTVEHQEFVGLAHV